MGHGAIASPVLNGMIVAAAEARAIPVQHDVNGRDTGTDAMSGVFASIDCAAATVGFPIRNMHTVSELGHTGDVLAAIHALAGLLEDMAGGGVTRETFRSQQPRLDLAE